MNEHYLRDIIDTFVLKSKRDRLTTFLSSKRRYNDFLYELLHDPRHIDPKCITKLPGREWDADIILGKLKARGAGSQAYMVSYNSDNDGTTQDLEVILKKLVGSLEDTLVYCWEARVAYYEGHEGWHYILHPPR